jgi:hypothetical protein
MASAAIDQERMMKAVAELDEKKRKKMIPRSASSGSSSGVPPKYHMVYTPPGGRLSRPRQQQNWGSRPQFQPWQLQQQPIAATTIDQPCSYSTATTVSRQQLSMLQLWEDGPLC